MKRTPGPWIVVKHAGSADEIWSDRGMIAELSLYPQGSQVAGANARLIAAAPELLEALKMFMDIWGSGDSNKNSKRAQQRRAEMWTAANTAVAKAEGK